MAFSTVEFIATAATGGLLGGFVQQFVQWRMGLAQRAVEDQRRQEDREHALEDARTLRRLDRYVDVLAAASALERQIWTSYKTLEFWALVHGAYQHFGEEGSPPGAKDQLPEVTAQAEADGTQLVANREALERAIYESWPLASSSARTASQEVIYFPLIWDGYMGPGISSPDPTLPLSDRTSQETPAESINTTPAWQHMEFLTKQLKEFAQAVRAFADLIRDELKLD